MIKAGRSLENPLLDKDDWFDLLTCSIVRQAVEEFRYYMYRINGTQVISKIVRYRDEINQILKFFNSKWFEDISPVHRDVICNQLKKEAKEYLNRRNNIYIRSIMEEL